MSETSKKKIYANQFWVLKSVGKNIDLRFLLLKSKLCIIYSNPNQLLISNFSFLTKFFPLQKILNLETPTFIPKSLYIPRKFSGKIKTFPFFEILILFYLYVTGERSSRNTMVFFKSGSPSKYYNSDGSRYKFLFSLLLKEIKVSYMNSYLS